MKSSIEDIVQAADNWSVEVTPSGAGKVKDFSKVLTQGTTVNVTFLPNSDLKDTVSIACRLAEDGMNPVPHIAARSLQSKDQLDDFIARLVNEAGVKEVLVIGGSVDKAVGPFPSSIDVLESGLLQKYQIRKIGVAGHPEGSPDISEQDLRQAIADKNRFAAEESVEMYIETQFCFDPVAVINWEKKIRNEGNLLPIRVGIAGPATIKSLLRFAQISGIGNSMRFITKQARNVAKIMSVQTPAALIDGLAHGIAADENCLISHFHYYPFGGFSRTVNFAAAVANGHITPEAEEDGFNVVE